MNYSAEDSVVICSSGFLFLSDALSSVQTYSLFFLRCPASSGGCLIEIVIVINTCQQSRAALRPRKTSAPPLLGVPNDRVFPAKLPLAVTFRTALTSSRWIC